MNTVVDISINQGAPLNCCTYIARGKRITIICELHWLLRIVEGQARQVTLPGREIDTGRGALVPFVTRRTPLAQHTRSLSTYIPPPLPISNRTQKASQRRARASTKTAPPPQGDHPTPTSHSPPQTSHPPTPKRPFCQRKEYAYKEKKKSSH